MSRLKDNFVNPQRWGFLIFKSIIFSIHKNKINKRLCHKVYIADPVGVGLIVYKNGKFRRFSSETFVPKSFANQINAGDVPPFTMNGGIVAINLSPRTFEEPRYLYYRPLASYDINYVKTTELQLATEDPQYNGKIITQQMVDVLPSQSVGQAMSSEGILFMGLTKERAVACWNIKKSPNKENIVSTCKM